MRLLIRLGALKACSYDNQYYHKLRGFLYELQKDSKLFNRHTIAGYKFFCFSNIFPAKDMRYGDKRTVIISCPSRDWIYWLRGRLTEMQELQKPMEIGEMKFGIETVSTFTKHVTKKISLITGTPIVLRIPKENYKSYGIESKRPFEYWRPEYDFNAFLKQISDNLVKKYNLYFNKKIHEQNIFQEFSFKRPVCVHRIEQGKEVPTVGSLWEFRFSHLTPLQQDILQLGLDAGFGELNSSGFGFMNVVMAWC